METITLKLSRTDYPMVMKTYGLDGAKEQAIRMCLAQKAELTEANLYSVLANLEEDLQNQTAMMSMQEKEE